MSTCQSATANAELSQDPTGTLELRREFIREVERRARNLRGRVRRTVGYETDALHLKRDAPGSQLSANDHDDRFEFVTRQGLQEQFRRWFDEQLEDALLDPVTRAEVLNGSHWTAPYVREAYGRGWKQATGRLMQEGVSVTAEQSIAAVFDLPVAERQLRQLYTRVFENLKGITDDMATAVRQELTRGLAEGVNPRVMARRLNGEVEDLTRTRLRTLARTEVINSHSTATLDRFQDAGVERVVHGEWSTAGDSRVCPICQALEGRVMTVQRMREGSFQFDAAGDDVPDSLAGSYRLQPPAHPNGRCSIIPVVKEAA